MAIADRPASISLAAPGVLVDRSVAAGDLAVVLRHDAAWKESTAQERQDAVHRLAFQRWRCDPRGRLSGRVEPRRRLVRAIATEALSVILLVVTIPLLVGWLAVRWAWRLGR